MDETLLRVLPTCLSTSEMSYFIPLLWCQKLKWALGQRESCPPPYGRTQTGTELTSFIWNTEPALDFCGIYFLQKACSLAWDPYNEPGPRVHCPPPFSMPLLPCCRVSLHFGTYSFPIPLCVERRVVRHVDTASSMTGGASSIWKT